MPQFAPFCPIPPSLSKQEAPQRVGFCGKVIHIGALVPGEFHPLPALDAQSIRDETQAISSMTAQQFRLDSSLPAQDLKGLTIDVPAWVFELKFARRNRDDSQLQIPVHDLVEAINPIVHQHFRIGSRNSDSGHPRTL